MKILMVTPAFFPSLGGIEQHVLNLSKQLQKKGHQVDVLTSKIGKTSSFESVESINVFRVYTGIKNQQELSFKGKNLVWPFFIKALILQAKNKYDLIHVHGPFSLLSVLPLKLFRIPIILTIHGNWINCVKGRRYHDGKICIGYEIEKCSKCMNSNKPVMKFKRRLLRSIAEKCNEIIAVSNDVKNSIKLKKEKSITVIPNVASIEGFFPNPNGLTEFRFNSLKKKILFIGSMIPEKGAKVLLETAKNINAEFIFVYSYANQDYLKEFNEFVDEKNINDVLLFPEVSNKKVREIFIPFSDIIVVPSLWPEPCSSVVTEAMASKKPVIASNLGGFTDLIINGVDGLLFEAGNSKDLEKKIVSILDDENLMKKISLNGFKKVQKELNWDVVSDKIIKVYRKVLN